MKVLGIITARKGSKGVPGKNMKKLCGKPLLWYTIEATRKSKLLDRAIISTDDDEMIEYARKNKIEAPFKRPAELANDAASSLDVVKHALQFLEKKERYVPDFVMILQPTSPMRTERHIDEAIAKLIKNKGDSLVSVIEVPHNMNPKKIMKSDGNRIVPLGEKRIRPRQGYEKLYARNGAAVYISSYDLIMKRGLIIGDRCIPYVMSKPDSVDIDDIDDFVIAEAVMKSRK